jgi:hypothetical protein
MKMKKRLITHIFFLITVFVFGVGLIHGAETYVSFAIYLSKTDARSETPLSKMELSKVPFFTDADIIEYRWNKHEIKLSPQGAKKFKQLAKEGEEGRAFVVMVDGVRCYQGALWKMIWSSSYPYPVILIDSPSNNIVTIDRAYPSPAFAKGEDPRNDKRIYDALKRKKKLKDADRDS